VTQQGDRVDPGTGAVEPPLADGVSSLVPTWTPTPAATVDPSTRKACRMNRNRLNGCGGPAATPLKRCVSEELARYFDALEGEQPCDLHKMVIGETEQALLQFVLEHTDGNQSRAAQLLGLNRGTLRKKLNYYGIDR